MKKILALTLLCTASLSAFAQTNYFFDPFADATSTGGSSYAVGSTLAGQSNGVNFAWAPIDTAATDTNQAVLITNANLTLPPGLPPSSGNALLLRNIGSGEGGRLNIGTNWSTNAATLYYSAVIQLQDITSLANAGPITNGGAFNMGFNNTYTNTQSSNPSVYGAPLYYGKTTAGDGYLLGVGRSTGSLGRFWEADPSNPGSSLHKTGDVVFVVVGYEIVPGATNDIARLWVNPDPSTFGAATYPTPTIRVDDTGVSSPDADLTSVNSFLIANRNGTTPNTMVVDELRIGYTWAAVTGVPPVNQVPVPALSVSLIDPNTVQLSWRGDATGYTLQGASSLLPSGTPWANISGTASQSGTNFIQTDTVSGMKFYRLISTQ